MTTLFLTGALAAAGCGAPSTKVDENSAELLGHVSYASDCTDNDKAFLAKVMHYGRAVAASPAFQQCVDKAVRTGFTAVRPWASWNVGPYMSCNGDPFQSADVTTQIGRALQAERQTVDVAITCTGAPAGNAVAGIDSWGQLTPEGLQFSPWLHAVDDPVGLSYPVCNGANGPRCRFAADPWPYSQAAGLVWHEASHQQGYTHDDCGTEPAGFNYQVNTMPYILGNCIDEVITRSANLCGDPIDASGNGLELISGFDATTCTLARDPQQPSLSWRHVGHPYAADKIAACQDGRIYALNGDKTLWVSTSGNDGTWTYVDTPWDAKEITCANNKLYALNNGRTLYRNDGSDAAVSWTYVSTPGSANQIAGATSLAFFVPYGVLYALNDDHSLWRSNDGAGWSYVGTAGAADRIAAAGGWLDTRVFALNGDKSLWFNWGDGCNDYWGPMGSFSTAVELTAKNERTVYLLDSSKYLWIGTVDGADYMTSTAFGQARSCDGTTLVPTP